MSPRLKLYLVVIAALQCISLSFILIGITGGFDAGSSSSGDEGGGPYNEGGDGGKGSYNTHGNSTSSVSGDIDSRVPEKVVLMVIDALRLDFLKAENFPFLMGNLRKYRSTTVLKYDVKVDSPTVTLPRVKTLVTGKSPVYMDVIRNFQTADTLKGGMNQPNLISSLRKELPDTNICFFGDETWLRLFPADDEHYSPYFKKWEGVTSFYVKDFYEVDNNVTRHLEDIDDCNFVILHYLGLDHIGHVHGPKPTELLRRKLQEMDKVIQHLHSHLSQVKTKASKNLMIITGDHGMANVGGHGGSSIEEVLTPLVGVVIGGMPQHHSQLETGQIKQIDIAPTLASVWNVAIPKESRGQLILDLVEQFKSTEELANSYQKNCKHLLSVLGKGRKAATYKLWWSEIAKMEKPLAIKKYIELENELSSALQNTRNKNSELLCSFVISMVLLICMELYLFTSLRRVLGRHSRLAIAILFFPTILVYFSSSFIEEEHYIRHYLYPSLLAIFFLWSRADKSSNLLTMLKILVLHRFSMLLNQTGDKWSSLPDLNDFIREKELEWLTASIAVILIYIFSQKTDKCSRSFKAALASVYVVKMLTEYVHESSRGRLHWVLLDSKLQKLNFCVLFFHLIRRIYQGHVHQSIMSSTVLFLLSLQRCHNLIVVGIVFAQAKLIHGLITSTQNDINRQEKATKSSNRVTALLSRLVLMWFGYSSFYYQGNSNGLATIDVSAGYVGIESYSSNVLIGSLIFANTYAGPILAFMFMGEKPSSEHVVMNGSAHVPIDTNNRLKVKSKEVTKKPTEYFPLLLLLSSGAECIIYSCSIMIFQNHLFIWSVFVPKLLYLIAQSVVFIIVSVFYAFTL